MRRFAFVVIPLIVGFTDVALRMGLLAGPPPTCC